MARVDESRDERDRSPLLLSGIVDCPECDTPFEWVFQAPEGVYDKEDLTDAPVEEVECPECGHRWTEEWGGWVAHEDAG